MPTPPAPAPCPARLDLGSEIGPDAFLQAARSVLYTLAAGAAPRTVRIEPASPAAAAGEETALAQRPAFRNLRFRNNWVIFPAEFEGRNVLQQVRQQTWTGKPATAR